MAYDFLLLRSESINPELQREDSVLDGSSKLKSVSNYWLLQWNWTMYCSMVFVQEVIVFLQVLESQQ